MTLARQRLAAAILGAAIVMVVGGSQFRSVARAQEDVTPGMLFGPLRVDRGQRVELCSTYLTEGTLEQKVHFRNLTTGEVTRAVTLIIPSGGGACATYAGTGLVVGMARAASPEAASNWLSLENALIGTMSIVDNGRGDNGRGDDGHGDDGHGDDGHGTRVSVPGIAKFWKTGL